MYRAFYYYVREFQPVLTHQYVTLYDYLLFFHLTYKTKIGTAKRLETTKSKPLGLIIIIGQSGMQGSNQIIFITLLREMLHFYTFYQPQQTLQKCCTETILLSQTSIYCRVTEIFTEVNGEGLYTDIGNLTQSLHISCQIFSLNIHSRTYM